MEVVASVPAALVEERDVLAVVVPWKRNAALISNHLLSRFSVDAACNVAVVAVCAAERLEDAVLLRVEACFERAKDQLARGERGSRRVLARRGGFANGAEEPSCLRIRTGSAAAAWRTAAAGVAAATSWRTAAAGVAAARGWTTWCARKSSMINDLQIW